MFPARAADPSVANAMAATLTHRGPDETSTFLSADHHCAISFRRLAIIDPAGSHQPLSSPHADITVAFNGEIYNFPQLRADLRARGASFRTAGDTEVLLHLYLTHGRHFAHHLAGMYAFALYDARAHRLLLCRDPLGQKPLWYAHLPDRLLFASEPKALLAHPLIRPTLDMLSIQHYLRFGYIPAPRTAWQGLTKLPPATALHSDGTTLTTACYWQPPSTPSPPPVTDAIELIRHTVTAAVTNAMVSDVPIAALLSGGLDSSIIVAIMAQAAGAAGGVRTFTATFPGTAYDESVHARRLASHCGTDHTDMAVPPPEAEQLLASVVASCDEPFADSSIVPTSLICAAAREHVKVVLAGDGADETFAGYDRHRAMWIADRVGPVGRLGIASLARFAHLCPRRTERHPLARLARFAAPIGRRPAERYLIYKQVFAPTHLARLLPADAVSDVPVQWFLELFDQPARLDVVGRAQRHDLLTYLPDDLLVKSDRASMASSLELRAPFLERPVVELGLSLPPAMKVNWWRGKIGLRQAFADMLPQQTLDRPKRGFGVPLAEWLRGSLRAVMLESLTDSGFADRFDLCLDGVRRFIGEHLSGREDHSHRLWALLVLARWHQHWR